jgi:hypothetical protein
MFSDRICFVIDTRSYLAGLNTPTVVFACRSKYPTPNMPTMTIPPIATYFR